MARYQVGNKCAEPALAVVPKWDIPKVCTAPAPHAHRGKSALQGDAQPRDRMGRGMTKGAGGCRECCYTACTLSPAVCTAVRMHVAALMMLST